MRARRLAQPSRALPATSPPCVCGLGSKGRRAVAPARSSASKTSHWRVQAAFSWSLPATKFDEMVVTNTADAAYHNPRVFFDLQIEAIGP